ncbi:hypothetical protein BaRGS_00026001 [Batillaria attramentaria]|uniref:Secreted protein n=1 Tax=Batillaria attramentaria TaxID=370345 RepID=A0ABD0K6F3_9CAEN
MSRQPLSRKLCLHIFLSSNLYRLLRLFFDACEHSSLHVALAGSGREKIPFPVMERIEPRTAALRHSALKVTAWLHCHVRYVPSTVT